MAPCAKRQPDLALSGGDMRLVLRLRIDGNGSSGTVHLLMKRNRYHRPVILQLTEDGSLLPADSDDFELAIINRQCFSNRIDEGEEIVGNIRTDDANSAG